MSNHYVLVLYSSRDGSTRNMAERIAHGIETLGEISAKIRTVPNVSTETTQVKDKIPTSGDLYVNLEDLENCSALAVGSPVNFGNMSASLKHFFDSTTPLWLGSRLSGKPAGVFTSGSSLHGGQETTLISMMLPLLHHGMLITGLPFSETALIHTKTGGTPYGPSHISGTENTNILSSEEKELCAAFGKRLANLAIKCQ